MSPQLYGKRAAWEDPSKWVNDTYPWSAASLQQEGQSLLQLRPEDVGYDGYSSSKEGASSKQVSQSDTEGDPLASRRFFFKRTGGTKVYVWGVRCERAGGLSTMPRTQRHFAASFRPLAVLLLPW